MKGSKQQSKSSRKHHSHSTLKYGILWRGRVFGGIANPHLYTLKGAKEWVKDVPINSKIVRIRVTHEVVSEVIV